MKLTDAEKGPFHKMREISELKTQFQCEYRLHLKKKFGDTYSHASITGTELHRQVSMQTDKQLVERSVNRTVPFLIIIVTLIIGFLWIFW